MGDRALALLESEVAELREELDEVGSELRKLRREVRELRALLAVGAGSRSADWSSGDSREDSHTASRRPSQQSSGQSLPRGPVFERAPSVAETNGPATPSNPGTPLTCIERENICDRIGKFLARSLEGNHRGTSGRELLPNSSRIWVVVRDYEGVTYTPVRVFRTWTPAATGQAERGGSRRQHLRGAAFGEGSEASCVCCTAPLA